VTSNTEKEYLLQHSNRLGVSVYLRAFDAMPCQKHGHSGDRAEIAVAASVATLQML
jgi:hypothetical protein